MEKYVLSLLLILILSACSLSATEIPYSENGNKNIGSLFSDYIRNNKKDKSLAPLKTESRIWYDKKNLYVYFDAEIDDTFRKGNVTKRDSYRTDGDFLRVQIITDPEAKYAYVYYTFPQGNKCDAVRRSNLSLDNEWDSGYKTENEIRDGSWKSLITIPFKDFSGLDKAPYHWKVILTRYCHDDEEYYSVPYVSADDILGYFNSGHDIELTHDIISKNNFKFSPYIFVGSDLKSGKSKIENIGGDITYSPDFTSKLKLSYNPDFSDIPMDNLEDNYNLRYLPSYWENRHFFIEDTDIFGTSHRLFYSRQIVKPVYAVKLIKQFKNKTFGILTAQDDKFGEIKDKTFYGILAYEQRSEKFKIKTKYLNRFEKSNENHVISLKPYYEFEKGLLSLESNFSTVKEDKNKNGAVFILNFSKWQENFDYGMTLSWMSKDFRADMGQVFKTGYHSYDAYINFKKEDVSPKIKETGCYFWCFTSHENKDMSLYEQNVGINAHTKFTNKSRVGLNFNFGRINYDNKISNWFRSDVSYSDRISDFFNYGLAYERGRELIYIFNETADKDNFSVSFDGSLISCLTYRFYVKQVIYHHLKKTDYFDNNYRLCNLDFTFNFGNNLSFTNGLRLDDYNSSYSDLFAGYFSNIAYNYNDNLNIYCGFKTKQNRINNSFKIDEQNLYLKVQYLFDY